MPEADQEALNAMVLRYVQGHPQAAFRFDIYANKHRNQAVDAQGLLQAAPLLVALSSLNTRFKPSQLQEAIMHAIKECAADPQAPVVNTSRLPNKAYCKMMAAIVGVLLAHLRKVARRGQGQGPNRGFWPHICRSWAPPGTCGRGRRGRKRRQRPRTPRRSPSAIPCGGWLRLR